jgi:hydroxymethylpyrimidine pyrophosphatase-like HAD family hydrolase
MRYLVLASDYDGTLASQGKVDQSTLEAIHRLLDSGRKLLLVTGRELKDLKNVFPEIECCELVVAENGGLLYNPKTQEERPLAEPPNPQFLEELKRRGVPCSVGHGIVATWEPHQTAVLDAIQQLGLELQVSFNKGAVMVLPSGVNKQTGLKAALAELCLSPHNVVGIGDAENDHVFLSACECGVAVANALESLKERADFITQADHGKGVAELIGQLLKNDLCSLDDKLKRKPIALGSRKNGDEVRIGTQRGSLLFAGPSGSGKSTAATGVLEALAENEYQFCLIDPEGDYEDFMGAVQFGSPQNAPDIKQVMKALEDPKQNVAVNLLGIALEDRPLFFASLFPQILDLRARTARPHWVIVDEAHHMLPSSWMAASDTLRQSMGGMIFVTVHPGSIARAALEHVDTAVVVGKDPAKTLEELAKALSESAPEVPDQELESDEGMVWMRGKQEAPFIAKLCTPKMERRRHRRKYAQGELGPDRSFYFRGPDNKLNLRAHNLQIFSTIAEGVDAETWLFHLHNQDYSRWLREAIKDSTLADEVHAIENEGNWDVETSRHHILEAIEKRYTAAA